MAGISSTDLAIRIAQSRGTLRYEHRVSRFDGTPFVSIEDDKGVIEVADTEEEADARVREAIGEEN